MLAGLPRSSANAVIRALHGNLSGNPKLIAPPASDGDGILYTRAFVETCLRGMTEYAVRQSNIAGSGPAPASITLGYVPDESQEELLQAVDFSVFSMPLVGLQEYKAGRQVRHDARACQEIVANSIEQTRPALGELTRRISSYSPRDPIFLPPLNFHLSSALRLADLFVEIRNGMRLWADRLPEAETVRAMKEDLPLHVRGPHADVFQDDRGLFFPRDLSNHAMARQLDIDPALHQRISSLRSSYRFGIPLPAGFHHDVQFARRNLGGAQFDCTDRGQINLYCDYANVYPNDFVRPSA